MERWMESLHRRRKVELVRLLANTLKDSEWAKPFIIKLLIRPFAMDVLPRQQHLLANVEVFSLRVAVIVLRL